MHGYLGPRMRYLIFLTILSIAFSGFAADPSTPLDTKVLHNVFKIDDQLISGNSPDNEEAFRELQTLGVKTIISVDGSKPNVELAHKFGMTYVHLPIGYDAVPQARAEELTKVAKTSEGPIYMHCHHGKHRGPSAAAAICRAVKGWDIEKAEAFLKQAGTSPDYAGLYRDVKAFKVPTEAELAKLPAKFPEVAETADIVDAMVAIDAHFDALKGAQKAAWKNVPGFPDVQPAQPATLLWEAFREMARMEDTTKRNDEYKKMTTDSEKASEQLRQLLRDPQSEPSARDAAMQQVAKSCGACHKAYRN